MGWESSGMVGFDLGPLLEGQMTTAKLKSAYNLLIIGSRGFGALSLRWIQFAWVFRCARSSLFIYLGFYIAFNTVRVISRRVVGRAEETSTYSSSEFCTVNCQPTASNYQLSHLRPCREPNPGLRGGRRECNHSATVAPMESLNSVCLIFKIKHTEWGV